MELFYATRDGQSRRIAERIAERLAEQEIETLPKDLGVMQPPQATLESTDVVTLVAAIRYGKILPEARDFLAAYQKLKIKPKLVFLVVNLTSRKPGKETPEGSAYIRKAIKTVRTRPGIREGHPRPARLPALHLAGPAAHPVHHVLNRRPDRSKNLHRVYPLGRRRRHRPQDRRPQWQFHCGKRIRRRVAVSSACFEPSQADFRLGTLPLPALVGAANPRLPAPAANAYLKKARG